MRPPAAAAFSAWAGAAAAALSPPWPSVGLRKVGLVGLLLVPGLPLAWPVTLKLVILKLAILELAFLKWPIQVA